MVAYFKLQNNLFMAAGAAIGFLIAALGYGGIRAGASYADVFVIALFVFVGVVVGRIFAGFWAKRKLARMSALLYQEGKPEEFLARFTPVVEKTPRQTVEYVDGRVKLAYAWEALGDFEKGLAMLKGLEPENLRLHSLVGTALVENQRMRLYLLMEDLEKAAAQLERLRELREETVGRSSTLAQNLGQCVRLAENWLGFLKGEEWDTAYIREEASLAANPVHKAEMLLLLARMERGEEELDKSQDEAAETSGSSGAAGSSLQQKDEAAGLLKEAAQLGKGLYAAREAERLLNEWNKE